MTSIHPTTQEKWKKLANDKRADARKLPHGEKRESLLEMAQQLDATARLEGWLTGELRPPN